MRRFVIAAGFLAVLFAAFFLINRPAGPPPAPTATPLPLVTDTPTPVPTEVRTGVHLRQVTLLQPDLPSGSLVELPAEAFERLYTYDGNRVTFQVVIASDTPINQPLRLIIEDQVLAEVLVDLEINPGAVTEETVSAVWDSLNAAWSTRETIGAEAAGMPIGARTLVVRLVDATGTDVDSVTRILTVRPRPVVLVHGWNSTEAMWADYLGFLTSVNPVWQGLPVNTLSTGGSRPFYDAAWNAERLKDYIAAQQEQFDVQHVDIVAHSMGGLIAREYLHTYDALNDVGRPTVLRVVMLGTPNSGSPCASIAAVLNVFSRVFDGAWHFTPEYLQAFNQRVTETHGAQLNAMGGSEIWSCGPSGDGVVPALSAVALGTETATPPRIGHAADVDIWRLLFGAEDYETSRTQFNSFVLPRLNTPWTPAAPVFAVQSAGSLRRLAAPPVTQQYVLTIPPGSRANQSVVARGGDLGIAIAPVEGVRAELYDTAGQLIASFDADELGGLALPVLPKLDASAGNYTLRLINVGTQAAVVHLAVFETGLRQGLEASATVLADGTVRLTARLTQLGGGAPAGQVNAYTVGAEAERGQRAAQIPLLPVDGAVGGGSVYEAVLTLPAGVNVVAVRAVTSSHSLTRLVTVEVPADPAASGG